jgi:dUTP pyrophosphatase
MKLRVTKLDPRAILPEYHSRGALGFDIALLEGITVPARSDAMARTGLGFGLPDGYGLFIFPRSSIFKKQRLILANSVGVLDPDFSGAEDELKLHLYNPGDTDVVLEAGRRLVQGVILPVAIVDICEGPADVDSRGGFGTTGTHI